MICLSMVVCFFIYFHYKLNLDLLKMVKLRHEKDTLRSTGVLTWMILELTYNILICPPKFDSTIQTKQLGGDFEISLDGILFSIALGRAYLILRVYEQYSQWTNQKAIKVW